MALGSSLRLTVLLIVEMHVAMFITVYCRLWLMVLCGTSDFYPGRTLGLDCAVRKFNALPSVTMLSQLRKLVYCEIAD